LYDKVGDFLLIFGCLFIAPFGGLNPKWALDTRTWGKKNKRKSNMKRALHATKAPPPFYFLSLSLSLSLSFSVAINGAHQQSVTTIGTPPMPSIVTLTSSKF
jgi:hypothetical protein